MLKRILGTATFYLGTTLSLMYTVDALKERIEKVAETETVHSARQYVLVKLARGDYYNINGFETIKYDYKFYKTICNFHD